MAGTGGYLRFLSRQDEGPLKNLSYREIFLCIWERYPQKKAGCLETLLFGRIVRYLTLRFDRLAVE